MDPPPSRSGRRAAGSAALLVVVIALSMQTGSALAGRLIKSAGVVETLWLRTAIAAAVLAAVRPRSLRLPAPTDRLPLAALTLALLFMNLSFYAAISRAPLGIVVAVEFIGPLAVAVMGSRRPLDFVWIALAALGVFLLAGPTSSVGAAGLLLALCAAACWAAFLLLAKRAVTTMEPLAVTTLMLVGSAILLTPLLAATGIATENVAATLATGTAIAVLSSAFPYFLELFALSRVRAATYGVLLSIEPAMAALTGFLILGQRLTLAEGLAIAAVMVAAAGASWQGEAPRA
ncbi:MAG TPA: EamA family transporter [Thermoleophilia bacterium]|nr:EamA family transporter [Thermoleophilia bacterium]HQG03427.1 EamA family transporter [Thermoleophilia bacterium]HQG54124.1 EamA family transporter [Thermoleophilia bacterium]HQJ98695.1 EamA family transporter [Thermoleophilia bacterium]